MPEDTTKRHRVIIAGGGVAGLEAACALHALAAGATQVTLLEPRAEFTLKALSVADPFSAPGSRSYDLDAICEDHGVTRVGARLARVVPEDRAAITDEGQRLEYDSLLVAVGARPRPLYPHALTFRGPQDAESVRGLLKDLEARRARRLTFVIPPGTSWPLPLYELALMTAERAHALALEDVEIALVTPEDAALAIFGTAASSAVSDALLEAGVHLHPRVSVTRVLDGVVHAMPGDVVIEADRVVALPTLDGPKVPGLPADAGGFIAVDDEGRVRGVDDVFAAGDGTAFPIKQGGIGAQQADAAASAIARRAGAEVASAPFRPVLRSQLLSGSRSHFLRQAVTGGGGESASVASEHILWWPPSKVAAPYLAPYLERLDHGERGPASRSAVTSIHGPGDSAGGIDVLGSGAQQGRPAH